MRNDETHIAVLALMNSKTFRKVAFLFKSVQPPTRLTVHSLIDVTGFAIVYLFFVSVLKTPHGWPSSLPWVSEEENSLSETARCFSAFCTVGTIKKDSPLSLSTYYMQTEQT